MTTRLPDLLLFGAVAMLEWGLYLIWPPLALLGGAGVLLLVARAEVARQRQRPPNKGAG